MAQEGYVNNMYGSKMLGDLCWVFIQAVVVGGAGVATVDAANSSPNVTIARNAAGQYTITFPMSQFVHPVSAITVLAEQLGSQGFYETIVASSGGVGSATVEFGTAPGTAAEVADTTRLVFTLIVGAN